MAGDRGNAQRTERIWPRRFGRGPIGPDFFHRTGLVDTTRTVEGQLDTLDAFAHPGFDPGRVHTEVRAFYERTARYHLHVSPTWHRPFRPAGKVFAWFARYALGQLVLPTQPEGRERVTTRLFALHDPRDPRPDARGYVRAYGEDTALRANFVAAYATHAGALCRHLSAAFPLPFCALVAVLRFEDGPTAGGLSVTSAAPAGARRSDAGLFLATPLGVFRLPVQERIDVWVDAAGVLRAEHRTRVGPLRCFTLAYTMTPRDPALSE